MKLAKQETERLEELELVVERGLGTFVEIGTALLEIREGRLYRATHERFEDYCRERWGFTRARGNQLIAAADVATIVAIPNEAQARELASLRDDPAELRAVVDEATARDGGPPSAATIRKVRQEHRSAGRDESDLLEPTAPRAPCAHCEVHCPSSVYGTRKRSTPETVRPEKIPARVGYKRGERGRSLRARATALKELAANLNSVAWAFDAGVYADLAEVARYSETDRDFDVMFNAIERLATIGRRMRRAVEEER